MDIRLRTTEALGSLVVLSFWIALGILIGLLDWCAVQQYNLFH